MRLFDWLRKVLTAAMLVAAIPAHSQSVDVGGAKFEPVVTVGDRRLVLNGAGVRYKLVFKVYAVGLYVGGKVATVEEALAATGPRRVHVVVLRDVDSNEMGKMFVRAIEQNATRGEFISLIPGTVRVGEIFSQRQKLTAGSSFSLDFLPGTGVVVLVNGKQTAEPIKEPEFFNALLKIWLGKAPVDAALKDALLGRVPPPRES
jgi:Chalcone isomerase-like